MSTILYSIQHYSPGDRPFYLGASAVQALTSDSGFQSICMADSTLAAALSCLQNDFANIANIGFNTTGPADMIAASTVTVTSPAGGTVGNILQKLETYVTGSCPWLDGSSAIGTIAGSAAVVTLSGTNATVAAAVSTLQNQYSGLGSTGFDSAFVLALSLGECIIISYSPPDPG